MRGRDRIGARFLLVERRPSGRRFALLLVTVSVVERWLEQAQQRRWQNMEQAITQRAIRAAMEAVGGFVNVPVAEVLCRKGRPSISSCLTLF